MSSNADRAQVAFNLENDRLTAVAASAKGSRVVVRAWVSARRPEGTDPNDPAALGRWVADELKQAGLLRVAKRGGAVFAVPRGEVVLKRLAMPPGTSEADLPGMVRLQMLRQLTVSPENAAIDFVPLVSPPGSGPVVLAGALQGDRLAWRRDVVRGAGIRLRRVGLRSAGAVALIAEAAQRRGGATMGIALGSGSTEFVVVEDGQLVFARATDLFRPDDPAEFESFAQRVAVEAKRTWMSYRVSHDSSEIEAVVVLGTDEAARIIADRCRDSLSLPAEAEDYPRLIEAPAAMTPSQRAEIAPLVGLLAEPVMGRSHLDFANPRRAPDLSAARRQRILVAALGLIVVGGGLMTMARMELTKLERRLDALESDWSETSAQYGAYLRTQTRVEHADRWMRARVNWLDHLAVLSGKLPGPRDALLDRLSGSAGAEVTFALPRGKKGLADGSWGHAVQAAFDLSGTVRRRETADALRAAFVADQDYHTDSRGADTPDRFELRLTTTRPQPTSLPAPSPDAAAAAKAVSVP